MTALAFFCCLTLSLLSQTSEASKADPRLETALSEARRAGKATLEGDWETLVDLTHPRVVQLTGGREKMLDLLRTQMNQMKEEGFSLALFEAKAPTSLETNGKSLYCLVPTTSVVRVPKGTIRGQSYLVGVSDDQGATWKFIDSSPRPERIREIFPEIPKSLTLPEKVAPQFEPEGETP